MRTKFVLSDAASAAIARPSVEGAPVVLASAERAPHVTALTMRAAMGRAMRYSPVLKAVAEEISARRGEAFQAGRRPNPELKTEVENFAGSSSIFRASTAPRPRSA